MARAVRAGALRITLAWAAAAAPASAGPVQTDGTESAQATAGAGLSAASLTASSPLTGVMPSSAGAPDPAASASALAVELIREAEAGSTAAETAAPPARHVQRTSAQPGQALPQPKTSPQGGTAEDDGELRQLGKEVIHWLKDKLPWLRSDDEPRSGDGNASLAGAEWSQSPLEGGGTARRDDRANLPPAPDASGMASPHAGSPGWKEPGRRDSIGLERNLLREAIELVREVLEHPMTWLVISLLVIGGLVMSRMDRRPK